VIILFVSSAAWRCVPRGYLPQAKKGGGIFPYQMTSHPPIWPPFQFFFTHSLLPPGIKSSSSFPHAHAKTQKTAMSPTTTTTASKRFETTAKSAQAHLYPSSTTLLQPHSRATPTHANTKTNLVLGTDSVLYETDAMARQKDYQKAGLGGGEGEREAFFLGMQKQKAQNQALKKALTATHFTLTDSSTERTKARSNEVESDGSDWEEEEEYEHIYKKPTTTVTFASSSSSSSYYSSPAAAAAAGNKDKHTKTRFSLGNDKNDYSSSSRDMNHLIQEEEEAREGGREGGRERALEARRVEVAAMREALTRTHISFGDEGRGAGGGEGVGGGKGRGREGSAYSTQYQDTFNRTMGMQSPSSFMTPTNRGGHPSLPPSRGRLLDEGEKMDYTTTSMALMGRTPLPAAQERKEAVMRARAMKAELTKSHVNLALDAEYF